MQNTVLFEKKFITEVNKIFIFILYKQKVYSKKIKIVYSIININIYNINN